MILWYNKQTKINKQNAFCLNYESYFENFHENDK